MRMGILNASPFRCAILFVPVIVVPLSGLVVPLSGFSPPSYIQPHISSEEQRKHKDRTGLKVLPVNGIRATTDYIPLQTLVPSDSDSHAFEPLPSSVIESESYDTAFVTYRGNTENLNKSSNSKTNNDLTFDVEASSATAPDFRTIIRFALPAIGVWLCNPLLSLIDTSCVGLLSGTAQQAALNPATAVTDYGALLAAFMYTATTNLVAGSHSTDTTKSKTRTAKIFLNAMQLSAYVGTVLAVFFILLTKPLLKLIIGNDGIDPEVFLSAMRYVRIRALGMPAAVMIGSAQSACLGMQDIRSPFYVLLAAAIVNFTGDMVFVRSSSSLIGGAAGAAWATTFSQYFAVFAFIRWLTYNVRTKSLDSSENGSEKSVNDVSSAPFDSSTKTTSKHNNSSAKGFLAGRFTLSDLWTIPSVEAITPFRPFFLPVTMTSIGRVSAYVAMSHVVSSSLGTLSMAANQIILSIFYCLCPIADSLNLTAQSFIPPLFEKEKSRDRTIALRKSLNSFLQAAMLFGAVLSATVCLIPFMGKFFTSDLNVLAQVTSIVPYLTGVFAVHGIICAGEGFLLGCKDLKFLSRMYATYFVVMPYFMLRIKWAATFGHVATLTSVWRVFLGYQIFRSSAWFTRLQILQDRTENDFIDEKS